MGENLAGSSDSVRLPSAAFISSTCETSANPTSTSDAFETVRPTPSVAIRDAAESLVSGDTPPLHAPVETDDLVEAEPRRLSVCSRASSNSSSQTGRVSVSDGRSSPERPEISRSRMAASTVPAAKLEASPRIGLSSYSEESPSLSDPATDRHAAGQLAQSNLPRPYLPVSSDDLKKTHVKSTFSSRPDPSRSGYLALSVDALIGSRPRSNAPKEHSPAKPQQSSAFSSHPTNRYQPSVLNASSSPYSSHPPMPTAKLQTVTSQNEVHGQYQPPSSDARPYGDTSSKFPHTPNPSLPPSTTQSPNLPFEDAGKPNATPSASKPVAPQEVSYALTFAGSSASSSASSSTATSRGVKSQSQSADAGGGFPGSSHASGSNVPVTRRYYCNEPGCGKSFTTSGHLARHARIHAGIKPYPCPIVGCTSRFSRQDNMLQHFRSHIRKVPNAQISEAHVLNLTPAGRPSPVPLKPSSTTAAAIVAAAAAAAAGQSSSGSSSSSVPSSEEPSPTPEPGSPKASDKDTAANSSNSHTSSPSPPRPSTPHYHPYRPTVHTSRQVAARSPTYWPHGSSQQQESPASSQAAQLQEARAPHTSSHKLSVVPSPAPTPAPPSTAVVMTHGHPHYRTAPSPSVTAAPLPQPRYHQAPPASYHPAHHHPQYYQAARIAAQPYPPPQAHPQHRPVHFAYGGPYVQPFSVQPRIAPASIAPAAPVPAPQPYFLTPVAPPHFAPAVCGPPSGAGYTPAIAPSSMQPARSHPYYLQSTEPQVYRPVMAVQPPRRPASTPVPPKVDPEAKPTKSSQQQPLSQGSSSPSLPLSSQARRTH